MASDEYYFEFQYTPAQYHAGIDKLWQALGVTGVQQEDCFTMAAAEIKRLRERAAELEKQLVAIKLAVSMTPDALIDLADRLLNDPIVD